MTRKPERIMSDAYLPYYSQSADADDGADASNEIF